MAKQLFHISLTQQAIAPPSAEGFPRWGSFLTFAGIVRDTEQGRTVEGIDYSAYRPMAEKVLSQIASEGRERFPEHGLWIEHRIGFVPAGDPSLHLAIGTPHSGEGFEISAWYLRQLKTRLPIWKKPIFESKRLKGQR